MDKEIKAQWLEALRSGAYQQTRGHLKDLDGYCCLGVLCDIVQPDRWVEEEVGKFSMNYYTSCLPTEVRHKVDMPGDGTTGKLMGMNDASKLSFDEIADWIEEYL